MCFALLFTSSLKSWRIPEPDFPSDLFGKVLAFSAPKIQEFYYLESCTGLNWFLISSMRQKFLINVYTAYLTAHDQHCYIHIIFKSLHLYVYYFVNILKRFSEAVCCHEPKRKILLEMVKTAAETNVFWKHRSTTCIPFNSPTDSY